MGEKLGSAGDLKQQWGSPPAVISVKLREPLNSLSSASSQHPQALQVPQIALFLVATRAASVALRTGSIFRSHGDGSSRRREQVLSLATWGDDISAKST